MLDPEIAYQALTSRDTRFDGVFFVGVTSTGIYCRPICPVKAPMQKNCLFFSSAEAAEKARFRPCLRCRPELAPGNAPVDQPHRVADRLIQRIEEGMLEQREGLEAIAAEFGLSLRQLRRIVQQELGVSPLELKQTRRMLLAKQLLTETQLPVTEVAYASGFSSLRRFNDVFQTRYRMTPSALRREGGATRQQPGDSLTLRLAYRPPYDWDAMLWFLQTHLMKEVEAVEDGSWRRTVALGRCRGWVSVCDLPQKSALQVTFSTSLTPVLPLLLRRLRDLFDLDAQPQRIAACLSQDALLAPSLLSHPGLRVPGAFDAFELGVRAIIGQQVTVKAATTVSSRFAAAFGEPCETPFADLTRYTALPERIAGLTVDEVAPLGIVSAARSRAIISFARACASGDLRLSAAQPPDEVIKKLVSLPGIGPWTAHYIAMRALRWPDAFPKEDIAIRNNLGGMTSREAEARSQSWRPWRSYAVMHIWESLAVAKTKKKP